MRVIVTGGRDYADRKVLEEVLEGLRREGMTTMVHGDCPTGADAMADRWAQDRPVTIVRFPANWEVLGYAAGPIRNKRMVDAGADLVVAFPGGRGTADTVRRAEAAGIKVVTVGPGA